MSVFKVKNFQCFPEATLDLGKPGVILLQGQNRVADYATSNASGKTTLLVNAPCWILYGAYPGQSAANSVIRHGEKETTGEIWTTDRNGQALYVRRTRTKSKAKLEFAISGGSIQSWDYDAAQERLTEQLGVTQAQFVELLSYTGRFTFAGLTDAALKKQLSPLMPHDLGALTTEARQRAKNSTLAVEIKARDRDERQASLVSMRAELDRLTAAQAQWGFDQTNRLKAFEDYDKLLAESLAGAQAEAAAADTAVQQAWAGQTDRSAERAELAAQVHTAQRDEAEQARALAEWQRKANEPAPDTTCRACQQALPDGVRGPMHERWQTETAQAAGNVQGAEQALTATRTTLEQLRGALAALDATTATTPDQHSLLQRQQAARQGADAALRSHTENRSAWNATSHQTNPHVAAIDVQQQHINAQMNVLSEIGPALVSMEKDAKLWSYVAKLTDKAGLTQWMLLQLLPSLTYEANRVLACMSPEHLAVEFKSTKAGKLQITAGSKVGGRTYGEMSQGERRRIEAAVFLAVHQLVSRCTRDFDWLVLDELLDNSMDSAGKTMLLQGLPAIAEARKLSIVVITNDPDVVSDRRNVQRVLCVEAGVDGSTVKDL